jgi:hypothetical protein
VSSYSSWSKRMSSPPWNYRNCVRTYAKAWIAARNQTCRSPEGLKEECEIRSQFLVSPRARVNLIEIRATLLMTLWQTHTRLSTNATKCCKCWAVSLRGAAAKSWLRVCEVFRSAATSFSTTWSQTRLKLSAYCLAVATPRVFLRVTQNTLIRVRDASDVHLKRWKNSSSRADLPD